MHDPALQSEIARNFDHFQRVLAGFISVQRDRFALIHDGSIVDFFDTPGEADIEGDRRFESGLYSIQQVTDEPVDLGVYANGLG